MLVTKFENRTGESILDSAVEYTLELDLADSGVAIVASRERVVETLALMNREPDTVVDWPIGREIALRDGRIRIVIAGQVDRLGQVYRISCAATRAREWCRGGERRRDRQAASTTSWELSAE